LDGSGRAAFRGGLKELPGKPDGTGQRAIPGYHYGRLKEKNMRHLALFGAAVLLSLAACGGGPEEGEPAAEAPKAEAPKPEAPKIDCCKLTADLKAQMPNCCKRGDLLCCKEAKADPKNKPDCCKKGDDLKAKMPDCCKKHAAGTPQACCDK
jgi:hypothetical protein